MRPVHLLLAAVFLASAGAAEIPSARWEGVIRIPRRETPLVLDLAKDQAGTWTGSVILTGLGVKGAALTEVAVKDSEFSASLPDVFADAQHGPVKFKAKLQSDGKLSGEFVQAGNAAPFTLEKAGAAQVELPVASTRVASAFEGEWKGEYELLGYPRKVTLKFTNPAGSGAVTTDFVIVGKRHNQVPVTLVVQKGDFLTLEAKAFGIGFEARLQKDSNELRGTFSQGPFELPLVLRRTP